VLSLRCSVRQKKQTRPTTAAGLLSADAASLEAVAADFYVPLDVFSLGFGRVAVDDIVGLISGHDGRR